MSGAGNSSRHVYTLKKLQGRNNYKQLTRDMSFALEEARLWGHVEETDIPLSLPKAKKNDSDDQIEKIYLEKEFLSVKVSKEWISKNHWEHLKILKTL